MRKTKMEKGITLIALIITIVVLLILAVVAINSITNDGILSKATDAATKWNLAVNNEKERMNEYENFLNGLDSTGGGTSSVGTTTPTIETWTQSGTSVTNGTVTLTVGQIVSGYTSPIRTTDPGWAILGAKDGKLLLVSKKNIQESVALGGKDGGTVEGRECVAGYINGIEKIDEICSSYLNSSLADEARSINIEDINRVTGYNPVTAEFGAGYLYQYGNTVTYTLNSSGKVVYTSEVTSGTSTYTSFEHVDGRVLTTSNSIDVENNRYEYRCSTYLTDTSSDAYKVLFKKEEGLDKEYEFDDYYWLASQCSSCTEGGAYWGLHSVWYGQVTWHSFWSSNMSAGAVGGSMVNGIRAVIVLKSGVSITNSGVIS